MNGRPTPTIKFGNYGLSDFINSDLAHNTNSDHLSFPWGNNIQAYSNKNGLFNGKFTSQRSDALATTNTRPSNWREDPWGFIGSGNTIIDDNERVQSTVDHSVQPVEDLSADAEEGEEAINALEAVKIPEAVAEGAEASTPWGLAAVIAQQLGSVTSQAITAGQENQSANDFASNIQQHGLSTSLNADIIRSQQQQSIRNQEIGGQIGSFFGPLGALIGHAIAGYNSVNQSQLQTAGSFQGWVNPQQTNIVASAQTSQDNGSPNQIDNVDTTNATSS